MTDHNEAMRLADELVAPIGKQISYWAAQEAAALLRQLSAERDQLRAEVERLRADEERIDYLECEANELRTREAGEEDYEWVVRSNQMDQPHERDMGSGKTIREAIDAARTQKDEG